MSDISDISDFMDFSPTRQSKVAACEKLRDTVHSISAMHSSISEGARTPIKKNSFLELYQMTSFDLAKKKDELVSELKTLPPCTRDDCKEHKIPRLLRILTKIHSASTAKTTVTRHATLNAPNAPQPKKGTPFGDPKKKRNFASKWIKEGISFANVVSGEVPNQVPIDDKKKIPHGFLSQDSNNTSDLTQVLELF
ncbi:hypothetical protein TNCV_4689071 [Trichonephila clavipes]|nr:hypothetical protein TNCV_4689071 [Trichonephila clavipes]